MRGTLRWHGHAVRAAIAALCLAAGPGELAIAQPAPPGPAPGRAPIPATLAPPEIVEELRATMARARERFEARDAPGVLAHVSEAYRSRPFDKATIREQLLAIYSIYTEVRARVVLDDVHMVKDTAWVYSTGEISGRLPVVGTWVVILSWAREPEVARREDGRWRLYGFQQLAGGNPDGGRPRGPSRSAGDPVYASSSCALIATVLSGVTAQSSAPRPSAVGRPRSSNGAVSKSGARACVV